MLRLRVAGKNITQNEITSIDNHIRSAVYEHKNNIMKKIDKMIDTYKDNRINHRNKGKYDKVSILEQLKHELQFLPDRYLSEADSNYFNNQLELLESDKFILREDLLRQINNRFAERDTTTYPYTYIDEVNKLRLKVRRKPFIISKRTKDKIMNKLKRVTHDYKFIPYVY